MNAKISKRPNQSNCSTSGYSSQISDLSCDAKRSLSLSSVCLSEPKIIRTSTPSNLVSTLQIGSLSTISSIQKAESAKTGLISSLIKFFLNLFSCFNIFKHSNDSSELSFDNNMPKIVLRHQKLSAPPVRQQAASFEPSGPEYTCQVRTKIRQNSFISSTPNRPSYNSFLFIDEKEIYDNMHSIESSQTSFNKAKYTVNTEMSTTSFAHEKIKSVPLLSSSPLYANNLVSSQSVSSSVMSSSSAAASASLQTSSSSFRKCTDPIYSSNFKKGFQSEECAANLNTERRVVPVYEDYLCDKEVESYFENPDYFDCYTNEILIVKSAGKIYTQNFACYDGHCAHRHKPKCAKANNYLYLSNEHKCKSASTSSGIVSGATSASISTLSSIKSNSSIMNYGGVIRQYKDKIAKMVVFLLMMMIHYTRSYSLLDMYDPHMSDWDSSFYGKPVCISIPSNMSLCHNINYKQMKMPNLLGHDSVEEVVYQSSAWVPLLSLNCHKDAQLFLCSMFAPVCVEQAQAIYPCRSLCESVRQSCESQMLRYSYPWPSMFNCSQFPENGLCVPSSDKMIPVPMKPTTTTTKTTTIRTTTTRKALAEVKPSRTKASDSIFLQDPICFGCGKDRLDMEQIVHGYCNSDVVLRGRIQTMRISRLDLTNLRPREKTMVNRMNRTASLYIKISRRSRKVFKGAEYINRSQLRNYVKEVVYPSEEYYDPYELNLYLMSNMHLQMSGPDASRAFEAREPGLAQSKRKRIRNLMENGKFKKRFENRKKNHCVCQRLKKGARRINSKYLFMANILNSSSLKLNERKRRVPLNARNRYFWTKRNEAGNVRLVYLTNVIQWNKARPFIDYLENDSIDKTNMCRDIQKTASEIIKADNRLFFF